MRFLNWPRLRRTRFESASARNNSRLRESIAGSTHGIRRAARRNRVLFVTLLAVGGLVAALTSISMAQGEWTFHVVLQGNQPPAARFGAASAYDGVKQEVLIFGGFVGSTSAPGTGVVSGPPISTDGKLHAYSSAGWERRDSAHAPLPRGFASMVYDGARRNVVLFGGAPYRSNAVLGDTWIWDGNERDWTLVEPPEPRPDPRQNASMVYDPHHRVVVMFGGRGLNAAGTGLVPLGDTWTWNGSKWTIMPRAGSPSPRHSAAMAYDVCRAEAVMFGGIGDAVNNFVPQPGETWIWNGENKKWTQKSPLVSPTPRRIGASMGYSGRSGRVLLYGGLATTDAGVLTAAVDHDVWRWDGEGVAGAGPTWERMNSELTTAASVPCAAIILCGLFNLPLSGQTWAPPPPRAYASFTGFNLFGGTPYTDLGSLPFAGPTPQVAFGDHFKFQEANTVLLGLLYGDFGLDNPVDNGTASEQGIGSRSMDTPFTRRCVNPVPLPPDENAAQIDALQAEAGKVRVSREGVREFGRLPVLVGTNWPTNNRNESQAANPNPKFTYIPPPDCPNRGAGETGTNTYLVTDPKRDRIYQFFICDYDRGYEKNQDIKQRVNRLLIQVHDGTTLEPLAKVIADPVSIEGGASGGENFRNSYLLHDAGRGFFYLRSKWQTVRPTGASDKSYDEWVTLSQDLIEAGKDPLVERRPYTQGSVVPPINLSSFFNHPKTGRAKVFFNAGGSPPQLGQWDLKDWREDWRGGLTGCASLTAGGDGGMRVENRVYITCTLANKNAVARITLEDDPADGNLERVKKDASGTPIVELFPGPSFVTQHWGDPKTERMLLVSQPAGRALWVFDGKVSRYVGRAGISSTQHPSGLKGVGFDGESARLYVHIPDNLGSGPGAGYDQGGLLMLDTGLTPVPQPLKFPQFSSVPGLNPIASLPPGPGVPRRVFIRRAMGNMQKYPDWETVKFPLEMFYTVLADEVPVPGKADLAQLDALTIPVAEQPGKTEVGFDAEGSGYGIRLRSVGGIWTALRAFQQLGGEIPGETVINNFARHLIPGCVFPDRELMAGWVPQARLSDLDALARSSGLDVDSSSKVDLEGPFSRCNPSAEASNFPPSAKPVFDTLWPLWQMVQFEGNKAVGPQLAWDQHFKEVECVGDALATNTATVGNVYGSANCVQKQGLVEATARGSASGVGPLAEEASKRGFSVGEGYSNVTVARDPDNRGVVVTSTAIAKGIQIPGLTIARVETKAVAWSNGRPSDPLENPRAIFTREICGVVTPDYSNSKCLSTGEQKQMVDNWNKGWGINSKMILPTPDPELLAGSPGGYIAGVIKPLADEIEDQLFAKDYLREVPGLVIEFYKDSVTQGPGRQVLQLAATRAVAGLGVQCNPDLVYSSSATNCVALTFEDDPVLEEFEEEEEFTENAELDSTDGLWQSVEESGPPEPLALGKSIGRFIQNLPIIRQLPIRQIGEALLAFPVWLLLGLPLLLASRRFALAQAQRGS